MKTGFSFYYLFSATSALTATTTITHELSINYIFVNRTSQKCFWVNMFYIH